MATHWIDFLAVASFIIGLTRTIMDNASLADVSRLRYEEYVRMLSECDRELDTEGADLDRTVRHMERVVLEELRQFCQSAYQISYRL